MVTIFRAYRLWWSKSSSMHFSTATIYHTYIQNHANSDSARICIGITSEPCPNMVLKKLTICIHDYFTRKLCYCYNKNLKQCFFIIQRSWIISMERSRSNISITVFACIVLMIIWKYLPLYTIFLKIIFIIVTQKLVYVLIRFAWPCLSPSRTSNQQVVLQYCTDQFLL